MSRRLSLSVPNGLKALAGRMRGGVTAGRAALAAGLIWTVLVLAYAFGFLLGGGAAQPRGTVFLDGVFFLIALFLPLLLIWLSAWLALELKRQREAVDLLIRASAPLAEALDATRRLMEQARPASADEIARAVAAMRGAESGALKPSADPRRARLKAAVAAAGRREPDASRAPAMPPSEAAARRDRAAGQATLPLIPEAPSERPGWPVLIRALDFPRDAEDRDGFRALEQAQKHHGLSQTLRAAEDVLNHLSQEGIYMEDLAPAPSDGAAWRAFIEGARGTAVDGVGGVRDPRALAAAKALMRSDPIFRDSALFFQRRFGRVLSDCAQDASDGDLLALADTRSGRAFQLLARVNGAFDGS